MEVQRGVEILRAAKGKSIAVVGDIMLDRYFWGTVSRLSPEAPVPIIDVDSESFHLGGAANVASNLTSLEVNTLLCGVSGQDNSAAKVCALLEEQGLDSSGIIQEELRPTTVKTRVIGNNQQIARVDRETKQDINQGSQERLIRIVEDWMPSLSGLILEDYNKGVLTASVISELVRIARRAGVPVYVDPKKNNFFAYEQVTVFKPNRKEASEALGMPLRTEDDFSTAANMLLERLHCTYVLLTLGELGMRLYSKNGNCYAVPTRARYVADVSGAGDTVIATMATGLAGGASAFEAAQLANFAAGAVCERPGIVAITLPMIVESMEMYNASTDAKPVNDLEVL